MPQEMSFAQALNEARQIIVQQSNRIKGRPGPHQGDAGNHHAQTTAIAEADRNVKQKASELESAVEQIKTLTAKLEEMRVAKEQGEAVIDRQGQRLTQMQETIHDLEKQVADHSQKAQQLGHELEGVRSALPTQEDSDALAALASLLSAKKGAPAPVKSPEEGAAAA